MAARLATSDLDRLLSCIREWVWLLSKEDFSAASDYLTPIDGRSAGRTAEELQSALGRYSRAYREAPPESKRDFIPKVSDPSTMDLADENLVIYTRTDIGKAILEYDLPINENWSDLTAKFSLVPLDSEYGLALLDLRVL